jgi:hypothetical protein
MRPRRGHAPIAGHVSDDDLDDLAAHAEEHGNPVISLVALLRQRLSAAGHDDAAAWLRRGLTSQDFVDTALMLCARHHGADPPPPRWPSTLDGASWSKTPGRDQRRAFGRRAGLALTTTHDHTRPRCHLRRGRRRSRPFPRAGPLHRRHDHHRDRLVARLIAPRGPRSRSLAVCCTQGGRRRHGRVCPAATKMSYHCGRDSGMSDPAAEPITRCGFVVPSTTCMLAGWRVIHATAIADGVTP